MKVLYLIFLLVLVVGCGHRNHNDDIMTTDVIEYAELAEHSWNEYVTSSDRIQVNLHMKDRESYVSSIEKVILHNEHIFVLDALERKIVRYDMSGEPVDVLQRIGRGPGEYLHLDDFCVDFNGNIYTLDCSTSVLNKYGNSFEHLESCTLDFAADQIAIVDDSSFVFSLSPFNSGEYDDVELLYTSAGFNSTDEVTETLFLAYYDSPVSLDEVLSLPLLSNSDFGLFYHRTVTDYVYKIDSSANVTSVRFDFGHKTVPEEFRNNLGENLEHYSSFITLLQCYAVTDSKIFGMLYRYGREHLFVLDKVSSSIFIDEVVNPFYSYAEEGRVETAEYPLGASGSYFITCSRISGKDVSEEYALNLYRLL